LRAEVVETQQLMASSCKTSGSLASQCNGAEIVTSWRDGAQDEDQYMYIEMSPTS